MPSPPIPDRPPLAVLQTALLGELIGEETFGLEARGRHLHVPPQGTIESRWHIYASGYLARIIETLEHDYPAVKRVMGNVHFAALTERYLSAHPPRSFDLHDAGDRLVSFLKQDPPTEKLPFLPDLAKLEWHLAEAFVAKDPEPLLWGELQRMAPEAVSDLPLFLNPGTAIIRSAWPIIDIRELKDKPDDEISLEVEGRPSIALVYRHEWQARCRNLDEGDARFIEAAAAGASLAELQTTAVKDGDDPVAVEKLLERFRRLVDEGLFSRAGGPHGAAS